MSTPPASPAVGPAPLIRAMRASGRRFAVTCGAAVALLSLLNDTPVRVASMRGAIAWAAVLLVVRCGAWFTERAWVDPPDPQVDEAAGEEGEETSEAAEG